MVLSLNAQNSKVVSWEKVSEVPVFPGCEAESGNENLMNCFYFKLQEHIQNNIQYPEITQDLGIEGIVRVEFVINEKGLIQNLKTLGPDSLLEKEATRIINLLPKMTPAKNKRKKSVGVHFQLPITFKLQ